MTYKELTIDDALVVFLLPTQGLALTRALHRRFLDSLIKSAEATDKRTRERHGARVEAFLAGCRSYSNQGEMALYFGEAFPKEARKPHFISAARLLRMHLVDRAYRSNLPAVTNRALTVASIPSREQLLRTVRAINPIKATAERRIGHPLLVQTIRQHRWERALVQEALCRRYRDVDEVKRYVRSLAKNGAFESVI